MKPYKRTDKAFKIQAYAPGEGAPKDLARSISITRRPLNFMLRNASNFEKALLLMKEFCGDLQALWRHSSAFPTFFKLIIMLLLCFIILVPICYPIFVIIVTYFTCKALFISFWLDQQWRLFPKYIFKDATSLLHRTCRAQDAWKVRESLSRCLLVVYSLATSVDYLCVIQNVLDGT